MEPCLHNTSGRFPAGDREPKLKHRFIRLSLLGLASLTGCTDTGVVEKLAETEPAEPTSGELLIATVPSGWKLDFSTKTPGLKIAEYSPDDGAEKWTTKIKFESLSGDYLPEPADFFSSFSKDQEEVCPDLENHSTFSGQENGYDTAVHLFICPRNKLSNISLVSLIKVIKGNEYFYVINRSQRAAALPQGERPLSEEEIAGWSLYIRSISVCDTEKPGHPCPQPAT